MSASQPLHVLKIKPYCEWMQHLNTFLKIASFQASFPAPFCWFRKYFRVGNAALMLTLHEALGDKFTTMLEVRRVGVWGVVLGRGLESRDLPMKAWFWRLVGRLFTSRYHPFLGLWTVSVHFFHVQEWYDINYSYLPGFWCSRVKGDFHHSPLFCWFWRVNCEPAGNLFGRLSLNTGLCSPYHCCKGL